VRKDASHLLEPSPARDKLELLTRVGTGAPNFINFYVRIFTTKHF
jgi:hypothetical protein